jgi:hypothetical protein
MMRFIFLAALCVVVSASVHFPSTISAQPTTPNLQGTWECTVSGTDTEWKGEKKSTKFQGTLYIYQIPLVPNEPNLTIQSEDDPEDPFDGFVQGMTFSFYKNNKHGDPNVGREIIIGTVGKKLTTLKGSGTGFDSNTDWGSTWSEKISCKKISDDVPER